MGTLQLLWSHFDYWHDPTVHATPSSLILWVKWQTLIEDPTTFSKILLPTSRYPIYCFIWNGSRTLFLSVAGKPTATKMISMPYQAFDHNVIHRWDIVAWHPVRRFFVWVSEAGFRRRYPDNWRWYLGSLSSGIVWNRGFIWSTYTIPEFGLSPASTNPCCRSFMGRAHVLLA